MNGNIVDRMGTNGHFQSHPNALSSRKLLKARETLVSSLHDKLLPSSMRLSRAMTEINMLDYKKMKRGAEDRILCSRSNHFGGYHSTKPLSLTSQKVLQSDPIMTKDYHRKYTSQPERDKWHKYDVPRNSKLKSASAVDHNIAITDGTNINADQSRPITLSQLRKLVQESKKSSLKNTEQGLSISISRLPSDFPQVRLMLKQTAITEGQKSTNLVSGTNKYKLNEVISSESDRNEGTSILPHEQSLRQLNKYQMGAIEKTTLWLMANPVGMIAEAPPFTPELPSLVRVSAPSKAASALYCSDSRKDKRVTFGDRDIVLVSHNSSEF